MWRYQVNLMKSMLFAIKVVWDGAIWSPSLHDLTCGKGFWMLYCMVWPPRTCMAKRTFEIVWFTVKFTSIASEFLPGIRDVSESFDILLLVTSNHQTNSLYPSLKWLPIDYIHPSPVKGKQKAQEAPSCLDTSLNLIELSTASARSLHARDLERRLDPPAVRVRHLHVSKFESQQINLKCRKHPNAHLTWCLKYISHVIVIY